MARHAVAQTDGVVIPVDIAKPQEQPPCSFKVERIDELLAQQAHRRRAQKDHALFVQPDDSLIGPEIKDLGEMVRFQVRRRN